MEEGLTRHEARVIAKKLLKNFKLRERELQRPISELRTKILEIQGEGPELKKIPIRSPKSDLTLEPNYNLFPPHPRDEKIIASLREDPTHETLGSLVGGEHHRSPVELIVTPEPACEVKSIASF